MDDKHSQVPNKSTDDIPCPEHFDPFSLMALVARGEEEVSVGDALLQAGQTLYSPCKANAGQLKRIRPNGVIEVGVFFDGKFRPIR